MAKKVLDEQTLQTLLQLIATEIKKKSDSGHVHSQYVTTTAFNSALGGINSFEVEVVDTLPESNMNNHTVYLVPKTTTENDDVYDEYMYINNKWEHIGNTQINLEPYATKDYVDGEIDKLAGAEHTHEIADVNGLQTALNGKSEVGHKHVYADITDAPTVPTKVGDLENDTGYQTKSDVDTAIANAVTGGTIDLSGYTTDEELNAGLNAKADKTHEHTIAEVSGLQTTLNAKATKTELSAGLEGKANATHTHSIAQVTNLQSTLNNKAEATHTHKISEITNLQENLNAKLNSADLEYLTVTEVTNMWNEELAD